MKLKQFNFKKVKSTNQTAIRIIRKTKNEFLSKSIQYFNKNSSINKIFTKIADEGLLF